MLKDGMLCELRQGSGQSGLSWSRKVLEDTDLYQVLKKG